MAFFKVFFSWAGLLALVTLPFSGCQMTGGSETSAGGTEAVMCAKCQTTWVKRSRRVGKRVIYRTAKVMTCPDCESAVASFFKTGQLGHTCPTCGDALQHCTVHEE